MDKIIFYLFLAVIVPFIISLYTFGNMVYTIGEFKEHTNKVPHVILILLIKLIFVGILSLNMFHYFLHNYIPENFYFVSVSLNIYLLLEFISINKSVKVYREYLETHQDGSILNTSLFENYVLINARKLLKANLYFYTITQLVSILIGIILVVMTVHFFSLFNILLLITYICLFGIKYYNSKYMSTL